jgi:hypothetical protein
MQTEREAEALLRAVGERYAGLPSYRDHGCVRWRNDTAAIVQFRTRFAREIGLHFEFTRAGRTESITGLSSDPEGLMDALAGPTGVSLGAAHTIPALLLPGASQSSWSLLQLSGVRAIARPANLEVTRDLIWVGGTGWAGQVLRVAVDPQTLLIWHLEDDGLGELRPYHTEYEPDATGSVLPEEVLSQGRGRV